MGKRIKKLMVFGLILFFTVIFFRNADAGNENPLEPQTPSWIIPVTQDKSNTESTQETGMISFNETLEPISGFSYVTNKILVGMFSLVKISESVDPNNMLSKWPNVVYARNPNTGQFFNPETGTLAGEFGELRVTSGKQGEQDKAVIIFPIRGETSELTAREIIKGQDFGQLTKLVNNNGEEGYVVITEVFYRTPVLSFTRGGWIVKYIDKDCKLGEHKEKYLDLFMTQLGWNHIFYQPKSD